MRLADTNVILEILLGQDKADEAEKFVFRAAAGGLCITDYALHSIGNKLLRERMEDTLIAFIREFIEGVPVTVIALDHRELIMVAEAARRYRLDFDDAYQYTAATLHDLTIVSYDTDFDRTGRGRQTPEQVLTELT